MDALVWMVANSCLAVVITVFTLVTSHRLRHSDDDDVVVVGWLVLFFGTFLTCMTVAEHVVPNLIRYLKEAHA